MIASTENSYLAHRAEREAVLAAATGDDRVAAVHQEMSRRYSDQLLRGLGERPATQR